MKKVIIILVAAFLAMPVFCVAASSNAGSVTCSYKKPKKVIKEVVFNVYLHCENCVKKIRENISYEKGVTGLEVSLEKQTVTVKYDVAKTSEAVLRAAIEKLGFKVK